MGLVAPGVWAGALAAGPRIARITRPVMAVREQRLRFMTLSCRSRPAPTDGHYRTFTGGRPASPARRTSAGSGATVRRRAARAAPAADRSSRTARTRLRSLPEDHALARLLSVRCHQLPVQGLHTLDLPPCGKEELDSSATGVRRLSRSRWIRHDAGNGSCQRRDVPGRDEQAGLAIDHELGVAFNRCCYDRSRDRQALAERARESQTAKGRIDAAVAPR